MKRKKIYELVVEVKDGLMVEEIREGLLSDIVGGSRVILECCRTRRSKIAAATVLCLCEFTHAYADGNSAMMLLLPSTRDCIESYKIVALRMLLRKPIYTSLFYGDCEDNRDFIEIPYR